MDCSLPGSSVHGILQARILEWVAISFSKGIDLPDPGPQQNIYFCFMDYAKAFDCVDHNKLENSERDGEYQTSCPAS